MAIIPLHKDITKEVLREFGFSEKAADLAANANAKVDEKQGSDASESNLHAMAGYTNDPIFKAPKARLQNEDEARKEVEWRLSQAKIQIVRNVLSKEFTTGLQLLGAALHTVQDRAFHNFEPWPHDGLGDAIKNDPNYMFAHGMRDLGGISKFDFKAADGVFRFAAEWTFQLNRQSYLSVQGFCEQGVKHARGPRIPGTVGMDTDPHGCGGMLTFTMGDAPGSNSRPQVVKDDLMSAHDMSANQSMLTQGPAARAAARVASSAFVREIKLQVLASGQGQSAWEGFLKFGKAEEI
jgi:hypothetical protein